ncbi:hypothetical protein I553_10765 [Mycobacterium xenopi 4042]|uniref:Uncharacterized protein n=1 Tax=Mycobacterium xenopi 4042 TaxID=1299334 RepID=X8DCJ8_MYCXE|nr:hypothetical protein I553_10765 [Mycobacterium xenopi 4042]
MSRSSTPICRPRAKSWENQTRPQRPRPGQHSHTAHPDWTGNANATAATASAALQKARTHLYSTAHNSADITATAARISAEAQQQLDAIAADWNHTKAAAATTPARCATPPYWPADNNASPRR